MSTWRPHSKRRLEIEHAPEPWAAKKASNLWPAVAQTNFPACSEKRLAIAKALVFLIASPVKITAPVSISS